MIAQPYRRKLYHAIWPNLQLAILEFNGRQYGKSMICALYIALDEKAHLGMKRCQTVK